MTKRSVLRSQKASRANFQKAKADIEITHEFIRQYKQSRKELKAFSKSQPPGKVRLVGFERFVTSNTFRSNLLKDLGLKSTPVNSFFNSDISIKNIGLYRKEDFKELMPSIKLIEDKLKRYLWK